MDKSLRMRLTSRVPLRFRQSAKMQYSSFKNLYQHRLSRSVQYATNATHLRYRTDRSGYNIDNDIDQSQHNRYRDGRVNSIALYRRKSHRCRCEPTGYNGTFTITVTSPTTFTYTVASTLTTPATGTKTANPCVAFTGGAVNTGGTDAQHMQCYATASMSGTTTFNRYTIFNGTLSLGGTSIFNGTPTAPAVYAFTGGLNLGGTSTFGAGIYYIGAGLGSTTGNTSCAVTANTATTTCPLNNNAYGGVTFALTSASGSFTASRGLSSGPHYAPTHHRVAPRFQLLDAIHNQHR